MWERVRAACGVLFGYAPPSGQIQVRRPVVRVEIKLSGRSVQTDMEVTVPLLESIANGIGMTLVPAPSRERH